MAKSRLQHFARATSAVLFALCAPGLVPAAQAQVTQIDPNSAIDSDLNPPPPPPPPLARPPRPAPISPPLANSGPTDGPIGGPTTANGNAATNTDKTYHEDDLIGAAEGVFGKGAHGLALMIRDLLKKQGEPNAYITGREGGGAFVVGLRYGSGTLHHKIEGQMPVYWTGPSLGVDFGANAADTFVLVYNLNDSEDLFKRIGDGEGQAYLIGGFNVSYLRRGDLVVIPVRMGAGLRLGVNAGYMKFSHKQNWLPF